MSEVAASEWLDSRFAPLDTRTGTESLAEQLAHIANENPELAPPPEPEPIAEPEPVAPPPPPEPAEPKVIQNPDGSTVTIEKTGKGWKATLSAGVGQPEVFYGVTKDDLLTRIAVGKAEATKKIRELNRKVKLGDGPKPASAPRTVPTALPKDLTAEERVAYQAKFAADPAGAFDELIQRRFGRSPDEIIAAADAGKAALRSQIQDEVCREFLATHPGYYNHDENYKSVVGLLAKQRLGVTLTDANAAQILIQLVDGGYFTVEALGDAYEELNDEGLLHVAPVPTPVQPTPVPVPASAPETPVAAPPSATPAERRQPRAGFGIPASAASATPPEPAKPLSDQELANMSDAEVANLFAQMRSAAAKARRS